MLESTHEKERPTWTATYSLQHEAAHGAVLTKDKDSPV